MVKVLSVVGTRPEAIKMASVIKHMEACSGEFESRLVVTAQHRQMLDQILGLWGMRPDYDLDIMRPGQTLTEVTTAVLSGLAPILARERPDWVVVQGDTTTAMAGSLAAFYAGVPVGHVEAGLRTYDNDQPFPEEVNRRITAVLARLHFAPTRWAAENLHREGVPRDQVRVTGNTVIDAFRHVAALPFDPAGTQLADVPWQDKRVVVVTTHRRENFGQGIVDICSALRTLADEEDDLHLVFPVHPNPNVLGPVHRMLGGLPNVTLLEPLDYQPLVWLLGRCSFLITDSGGLQEEATGVGKPVLILRESTERPEGVEAGTAALVGSDRATLLSWARRLLHEPETYDRMSWATCPYGDGRAAEAVVAALRPQHVIDLRDFPVGPQVEARRPSPVVVP